MKSIESLIEYHNKMYKDRSESENNFNSPQEKYYLQIVLNKQVNDNDNADFYYKITVLQILPEILIHTIKYKKVV